MLMSIVNYVNYNYRFCENIDSPFLSKDEKANECFIKSCLIYKNLHEIFNRSNITLVEIMIEMDVTDFHAKFTSFEKSLDLPPSFQIILEAA